MLRIGLVAPEETGKSSYIVGLHGALLHGRAQYPVRFEMPDSAMKLQLDKKFSNLVKNRGEPRFPGKNEGTTHYRYNAISRSNPGTRMPITLVDYPGELLRGAPKGGEHSHEGLLNDLAHCDALIVLLDARHLIDDDGHGSPYSVAVNDVAKVVRDCAQRHPVNGSSSMKYSIPVAFCVTKFDLYEHSSWVAENEDRLPVKFAFTAVRDLFWEFFQESGPGNRIKEYLIMITGVSLGEDIQKSGNFSPFNLITPLEFCLSFAVAQKSILSKEERDKENRAAEHHRASARHFRNLDFFEKIFTFLDNGWNTAGDYDNMAASRQERGKIHELDANNAQHVAELLLLELANHLNDVKIGEVSSLFVGGKKAEVIGKTAVDFRLS